MLKSLSITLAAVAALVFLVSLTPPSGQMGGSSGCSGSVYTVRSGDSLSRIAVAYHTTWEALQGANGIPNANLIYPGERICIPGNPVATIAGGVAYAIYHPGQHYPDTGASGFCVYYAELKRADINLSHGGDAWMLPATARARGYHVGVIPAVGALAIFARGVQGASAQYGHAAYVVGVNPNGTFVVAAMAAPYRWVVSYSTHWVQPNGAVQFIYG